MQEVAERVARELAVREAVLERRGPRSAVGRERDEALAQVAGRGDAEIAPQPARDPPSSATLTTAVIDAGVPAHRLERDGEAVPTPERDDPGFRGQTARSTSRWCTAVRCPRRRSRSASCSAITTLRCRPPVQPIAIDRYALPSRS